MEPSLVSSHREPQEAESFHIRMLDYLQGLGKRKAATQCWSAGPLLTLGVQTVCHLRGPGADSGERRWWRRLVLWCFPA